MSDRVPARSTATRRVLFTLFAVVLLATAGVLTAVYLQGRSALAQSPVDGKALDELEKTGSEFGIENHRAAAATVKVTGHVRTSDGNPTRSAITALALVATGSSSQSDSIALAPDGSFSFDCRPGSVVIIAHADAYAPVTLSPIIVKADAPPPPPVEIVLHPGHTGVLRLVDPDSRPLVGTEVKTHHAAGSFLLHQTTWTTDADGQITIPHCAPATPVAASVRAAGFQESSQRFTFSPDNASHTWTIPRARPTRGVITSADGKPVPNAEIHRTDGSDPRDTPKLMARADDQGRYVLDSLTDGKDYWLFVRAPGHGATIVEGIQAGQTRDITLNPPLYIAGTLSGELDRFKAGATGRPGFHYRNSLPIGPHATFSAMLWAEVTITDGVGSFRIDDLVRDRGDAHATLELPDRHRKYALAGQPITGLAIQIGAEEDDPATPDAPAGPTRTVVLRFKVPPGAPAPRGQVSIWHRDELGGRSVDVKLDDGEARFTAAVNRTFGYSGRGLVGYWISDGETLVKAGDAAEVVEIEARPAGAIRARVSDPSGAPAGASVHALIVERPEGLRPKPNQSTPWPAIQTERGVTPGDYLLSPVPMGGTYRLFVRSEDQCLTTDPIVIDTGHPLATVDLRLVEGILFTGQLLDPSGQPAAGIPLRLKCDPGFGHTSVGSSNTTDADGRFTFKGVNDRLEGTYAIEIQPAENYQSMSVPLDPRSKTPMQIKLIAGAVLAGTVLDDATGRPLANRELNAITTDGRYHSYGTRTDAAGRFRFSTLPPGEYMIRADSAYPPGTTFTRNPNGGYTIHGGGSDTLPRVRTGQHTEVTLRYVLRPNE